MVGSYNLWVKYGFFEHLYFYSPPPSKLNWVNLQAIPLHGRKCQALHTFGLHAASICDGTKRLPRHLVWKEQLVVVVLKCTL